MIWTVWCPLVALGYFLTTVCAQTLIVSQRNQNHLCRTCKRYTYLLEGLQSATSIFKSGAGSRALHYVPSRSVLHAGSSGYMASHGVEARGYLTLRLDDLQQTAANSLLRGAPKRSMLQRAHGFQNVFEHELLTKQSSSLSACKGREHSCSCVCTSILRHACRPNFVLYMWR